MKNVRRLRGQRVIRQLRDYRRILDNSKSAGGEGLFQLTVNQRTVICDDVLQAARELRIRIVAQRLPGQGSRLRRRARC